MPAPLTIEARDAEEAATKTSGERFENAKQDFIDLRDILGPHYDNLTPTQRESLKNNFIDVATLQGLSENQFRNTVGYTLAAYMVMLDYARLEIARLRQIVNGQD